MRAFNKVKNSSLFQKYYKLFIISIGCLLGVLFMTALLTSNPSFLVSVLIAGLCVWFAVGLFNCFVNKSLGEGLTHFFVYIIFTAFALSYLYIFFWGVTAGFKTPSAFWNCSTIAGTNLDVANPEAFNV